MHKGKLVSLNEFYRKETNRKDSKKKNYRVNHTI